MSRSALAIYKEKSQNFNRDFSELHLMLLVRSFIVGVRSYNKAILSHKFKLS